MPFSKENTSAPFLPATGVLECRSMTGSTDQALEWLRMVGHQRGDHLGLTVAPGFGIGLATGTSSRAFRSTETETAVGMIASIEAQHRPRWTWWSADSTWNEVGRSVHLASCWDVAAVHRLCFGGWRADPARVWATLRELPQSGIPVMGQLNLLGAHINEGDADVPVRPDGYLRPEWINGAWTNDATRLAKWAALTMSVCTEQQELLRSLDPSGRAEAVAKSESLAELLCVELATFGLPFRIDVAEKLIESFVGPRPVSQQHEIDLRNERDGVVLEVAPLIGDRDLRNPLRVLAMLKAVGIDVPNTRAGQLEPYRHSHPFVDALLNWRKADRIGSTFGYQWLDEHVGSDGRLRGQWTGCDGAAGRMTASSGLHNMPTDLRSAVRADEGWVFVHADLGQIEPRVLAAISGDVALSTATQSVDLYAPIAARFGVERSVAKVAMLAAMYGQTSGVAGDVLRQMEAGYPKAMEYLRSADRDGQAGRHIRTYGGRLVRMHAEPESADPGIAQAPTQGPAAASRGRYARNAVVQGAAAELFKVWAAIVRSRITPLGGRLVMCLHDELLVHAPRTTGDEVASIVESALPEAAAYWQPGTRVSFVAEARLIDCWSQAK